jgi:hypothetical protein
MKITSISEPEPVELQKFPYPYQAAFTVTSDIDSGSLLRFRAIHALFCGSDVIKESGPDWNALGLTSDCPRFDQERGGVPGLGLEFADSFFLIGDLTTFGMYRYAPEEACFSEDQEQGENCAAWVRQWLKEGRIDSFHAFLHYTRRQVEPLLKEFYDWCARENVARPTVWINHSRAVTPSGLCPDCLQPNPIYKLARLAARQIVGPLFGHRRVPLRYAFIRYQGDTPGSPYYVNDLLAANGLRYVYLNIADLHRDQIALPEQQQNGRATILHPVTMDDGVCYWRFDRCVPAPPGWSEGGVYLRDSKDGYDASHLISERNLHELCRVNGTCVLCTHWTHFRSLPISDGTIGRFELLQRWRDAGKIWVTSTARLMEWTRRRTFLEVRCHREGKRLVVEIEGVDDPIFGRQALDLKALHGLCMRLQPSEGDIRLALNGRGLSPHEFHRMGQLCWLDAGGTSNRGANPEAAHACIVGHRSS